MDQENATAGTKSTTASLVMMLVFGWFAVVGLRICVCFIFSRSIVFSLVLGLISGAIISAFLVFPWALILLVLRRDLAKAPRVVSQILAMVPPAIYLVFALFSLNAYVFSASGVRDDFERYVHSPLPSSVRFEGYRERDTLIDPSYAYRFTISAGDFDEMLRLNAPHEHDNQTADQFLGLAGPSHGKEPDRSYWFSQRGHRYVVSYWEKEEVCLLVIKF